VMVVIIIVIDDNKVIHLSLFIKQLVKKIGFGLFELLKLTFQRTKKIIKLKKKKIKGFKGYPNHIWACNAKRFST